MSSISYKKTNNIYIGQQQVNIQAQFSSSDGTDISIKADVTGDNPPYDYKWYIEQSIYSGHKFLTSDASSSVLLDPLPYNGTLMESGTIRKLNSSLLRLDVTDSKNNTKSFYHEYRSKQYPILTPNLYREASDTFAGDPDTRYFEIKIHNINFMDSVQDQLTYSQLEKYGCSGSQINLEQYNQDGTNYRIARTEYYNSTWHNIAGENTVFGLTPEHTHDNNAEAYSNLANLGKQSVVYSGSFRKMNLLLDSQPRQRKVDWETIHTSLGNKSCYDILGNVDIVPLPPVQSTSDLASLSGVAGNVVYVSNLSIAYAWNPQTNNWDSTLASIIKDINNDSFEKSHALFVALKQAIFDLASFKRASLDFPHHKIKKEL